MDRVRNKLENLSTGGTTPPPVRLELMEEAAEGLGERRAIQDEKYFERRRRNNLAAKKSRDLRKVREDEMALRVAVLEGENAVLVSQVAMLREEAGVLGLYFLARTNTHHHNKRE